MKSGYDSILSLNIWSLPRNFRYFLFLFCLSLKKVFKNISYVKLSCRFYLSVCTWKHVNSIKILHITNKKLNMLDIAQNQFKRLTIPIFLSKYLMYQFWEFNQCYPTIEFHFLNELFLSNQWNKRFQNDLYLIPHVKIFV